MIYNAIVNMTVQVQVQVDAENPMEAEILAMDAAETSVGSVSNVWVDRVVVSPQGEEE